MIFNNLKVAPDTKQGFFMKKVFLTLAVIIGFGIAANAQDIILKKDGSEIKAKVIEVTDQQLKYKDFEFQNGPTRNINISEVFMVTYENGQKEVFNKLNETNTASSNSKQSSAPYKQPSATNCAKKVALGVDIGVGGSFLGLSGLRSVAFFAPALGMRAMYHFNPYFGVDFIKVNWITDILTSGAYSGYTMRLQIMPGIRGNSPAFFKCMSGYAAFRLGYGMDFGEEHYQGLCLETEIGLNFTPTVFAGFAYNYHKYCGYGYYGIAMHTLSFRLGFNLGK